MPDTYSDIVDRVFETDANCLNKLASIRNKVRSKETMKRGRANIDARDPSEVGSSARKTHGTVTGKVKKAKGNVKKLQERQSVRALAPIRIQTVGLSSSLAFLLDDLFRHLALRTCELDNPSACPSPLPTSSSKFSGELKVWL